MQTSVEQPIPGGFRRTSPLPPPTGAIRLREQLMAAARGRPAHIGRGVEMLRHWDNLHSLLIGSWFGDVNGSAQAARWTIERRLSVLGTPSGTIDQVYRLAAGTPVKLNGIARSLQRAGGQRAGGQRAGGVPRSDIRTVWENSTLPGLGVRLLVEEGHDFVLESSAGALVVLARGGQLIGGAGNDRGAMIVDGDAVGVLGFVDRVIDPGRTQAASQTEQVAQAVINGWRAPPSQTVLRSGDDLGLLVWKQA